MIGRRIQTRLWQLGMSQSELARRVGLNQSTVNGLIHGGQVSTTKLPHIARELGTTPAYLTGETDDPDQDAPDAPELSSEERDLIDAFRDLPPDDRASLLRIARSLNESAPAARTVHARRDAFHPQPEAEKEPCR